MTEKPEVEWNAEEILGINERRSSGLMVEIFPAGRGQVTYTVSNLGPAQLESIEAVRVLRACADGIEREAPTHPEEAGSAVTACDPTLPSADSPTPHDYEVVGEDYDSVVYGGSYEILKCRMCGRVAYSRLSD